MYPDNNPLSDTAEDARERDLWEDDTSLACKLSIEDGKITHLFTKFGEFTLPKDSKAYLEAKSEWQRQEAILNRAMLECNPFRKTG